MTKELMKTSEADKALAAAGFNKEQELANMQTPQGRQIDLPRYRIDHKDNGKHRLYIDYGESYLDTDEQEESVKDNTFKAVIFAYQDIRALWKKGEPLPLCSGIEGVPTPMTKEPVNPECANCPKNKMGEGEGFCKPKVRLWLLVDRGKEGILPFIFALSPTSIKHWNKHLKKLKRSELPVVAVHTVFGLEDVQKNNYRWAEVVFSIDGIAPKPLLLEAKKARDELQKIMTEISQKDFADEGDKQQGDYKYDAEKSEQDFDDMTSGKEPDLPF